MNMTIGLLESIRRTYCGWGVGVRRVEEFSGGGGTLDDSSSRSRQAKVARAGMPSREGECEGPRQGAACVPERWKEGQSHMPATSSVWEALFCPLPH